MYDKPMMITVLLWQTIVWMSPYPREIYVNINGKDNTVIMVIIPRELKEAMDKYSSIINWTEEIKNFVINKITELRRREEALNKLNSIIEKLPELPPGSVTSLVREDRDSH